MSAPLFISVGRRRRPYYGRIVVEMLLVLPLLVSVAMGAAEYGYFFWVKSEMQEGAVAGARAAVLTTASNASVTSAVDAVMTAAGLQTSGYSVTTTPASVSSLATGTPVTVTVSCSWGTVGIHPLPSTMGGIPNSKTVNGTVVMMRE